MNGHAIEVANSVPLNSGSVAVGYWNRVEQLNVVPVIQRLIEEGAMYHRNASGALSLAYVAAGRLIGHVEEHMNAWDCLAGQLMVAEAGGLVETQDVHDMIRNGRRVVVGTKTSFDVIQSICNVAWKVNRT